MNELAKLQSFKALDSVAWVMGDEFMERFGKVD